jgi:hypothetical protein
MYLVLAGRRPLSGFTEDDQLTPTRQEAIMNTKLTFAFEKETKGAVRYQEVGDMVRQRSRPRSAHSTSAKAQCRAARSRKHLLSLSQANNCAAYRTQDRALRRCAACALIVRTATR